MRSLAVLVMPLVVLSVAGCQRVTTASGAYTLRGEAAVISLTVEHWDPSKLRERPGASYVIQFANAAIERRNDRSVWLVVDGEEILVAAEDETPVCPLVPDRPWTVGDAIMATLLIPTWVMEHLERLPHMLEDRIHTGEASTSEIRLARRLIETEGHPFTGHIGESIVLSGDYRLTIEARKALFDAVVRANLLATDDGAGPPL